MVEDTTQAAVGETVVAEKPAAPTLDSLKSELAAAIASGNDVEVVKLAKAIQKNSGDIQRIAAEQIKKEAEALAGDREKLAANIFKAVKSVVNVAELEKMKAKGFTFHLDAPGSDGIMVTYKSVALLVPTVKTRTGGGGGSTGALKQETGLSRHELIDKYATDAEKGEIEDTKNAATTRPDSARYTAEKPVIKRILADNPQLIKR